MASNHKQQKINEEGSTIKEEIFLAANHDIGTSDFGNVVKFNCFVDKSLLIRTIFKNPHTGILITTLRRNGKSTNMDMVKKFVEIQVDDNGTVIDREDSSNYQIFKNLLIFQDKQFFHNHFAKYPVITVDFKDITNFDDLDQFISALRRAFREHIYLLKSDQLSSDEKKLLETYYSFVSDKSLSKQQIETGLKFLSKCLHKHFNQKVFVLIDEYDAPMNNAMFEENINMNQFNELLCAIFSNTLQDNKYLEKALLTGISYFASVSLPNNVEKYKFLGNHSFGPYYGLTEHEVDELFTKFKIGDDTQEQVKLYYNGYVTLKGIKLFSIWSILFFLKEKQIKNFWTDSGCITNLVEAMDIPVIRRKMESICLRHSVSIEIVDKVEICDIIDLKKICSKEKNFETIELKNPDAYLYFILQQGYLTFNEQPSATSYRVKAPNQEIIRELKTKLWRYYLYNIEKYVEKSVKFFHEISSSSEENVFKNFITEFNAMLHILNAKFDIKYEDTYKCIIIYILHRGEFRVGDDFFSSSRERLYFILYKDSLGIIIKLKYKNSSKEALQQIIDQHLTAFDNSRFKNVTEKMYIGLNVSENNVADISVLVNSTDVSKAKCF